VRSPLREPLFCARTAGLHRGRLSGVDHDAAEFSRETAAIVGASLAPAKPYTSVATLSVKSRNTSGETPECWILLKGGRIVDPVNGRDEIGDLWDRERSHRGAAPGGVAMKSTTSPARSSWRAPSIFIPISPAAMRISHGCCFRIAQGRGPHPFSLPLATAKWSTFETGCRYAAMGFTTVIEPAVPRIKHSMRISNSRIFRSSTRVPDGLGNDDFLLSLIHDGEGPAAVADYVGSALAASNGLGVKCINAGARPHSNTMCGPLVSMTSCLSTNSPHAKSSRLCRGR